MMRPRRCRIIGFSTACVSANAAVRLVASTASQSSRFIRSINWSRVIPALFTRMSIRPCRSSVAGHEPRRCAPRRSRRARPPRPCRPPRRSRRPTAAAFSPRAAATTRAPCAASALRDRAADAARRAGDERDASRQVNHSSSSVTLSADAAALAQRRRRAGRPRPRRSTTVHAAIDLLDQAREHRARAQLDERASRRRRSAAARRPPSAPATRPGGSAPRSAAAASRFGSASTFATTGIRGSLRRPAPAAPARAAPRPASSARSGTAR